MLNRNTIAIALIALTKVTASYGGTTERICTVDGTKQKYHQVYMTDGHGDVLTWDEATHQSLLKVPGYSRFKNSGIRMIKLKVSASAHIVVVESADEGKLISFNYTTEDTFAEGKIFGQSVSLTCVKP